MKIQLRNNDPQTGLEVLDEDTCWRLLAERMYGVGRIAFVVDARPAILPVNYAIVGKRIVMRTGSGSKLDAALHGAHVAFEIDHVDSETHTGWSVLVSGPSQVLTSPWDVFELKACPLETWTPIEGEMWIAIKPDKISGRKIVTSGHRAGSCAAKANWCEGGDGSGGTTYFPIAAGNDDRLRGSFQLRRAGSHCG